MVGFCVDYMDIVDLVDLHPAKNDLVIGLWLFWMLVEELREEAWIIGVPLYILRFYGLTELGRIIGHTFCLRHYLRDFLRTVQCVAHMLNECRTRTLRSRLYS